MTFEEFKKSLSASTPPAELSAALQALWFDGKGDWDMAHEYAQSEKTDECAWVHAYLHRKEGDVSNANYWYSTAGRSRPKVELSEEWKQGYVWKKIEIHPGKVGPSFLKS